MIAVVAAHVRPICHDELVVLMEKLPVWWRLKFRTEVYVDVLLVRCKAEA